jgi:hypothetical protein
VRFRNDDRGDVLETRGNISEVKCTSLDLDLKVGVVSLWKMF